MENPVISREYIRKNYIHKDKVREIKNKLKQNCFLLNNNYEKCEFCEKEYCNIRPKMKIIDELLEETEDENNNTFTMQKQEEQSTDSNK